MKINPILQKFESQFISSKIKQEFHKNVSRGDIVSVVYYDLEKEQVRLQQFTGICKFIRSRGLNTKINIINDIKLTDKYAVTI